MSEATPLPETVLCIPGPWGSRSQLLERIVRCANGYLFAGQILLHEATKQSFMLEFHPPDPRMPAAFRAAGPHWSESADMRRISDHSSVVYLVGHGGSRANAEALMRAAAALLDAGGLGVKVESSGLAHSPSAWRAFCNELYLFTAHRAYVLNVTGPKVYSCGMHNLGLKDAIVENFGTAEAVDLIRTFTWYLFTEEPSIQSGQTFAVAKDAPVYRIFDDRGVDYEEGSLFGNPYGFWRLQPK